MSFDLPGWADPIVNGAPIPLNGGSGNDTIFASHAHSIAAVIAALMEMDTSADPDGEEDVTIALAHLSMAYAVLSGTDELAEETGNSSNV